MSAVALDPVAAGLVDLAVARHREQVAQADRELDHALAPIRAQFQVARLDLAVTEHGWVVTLPDEAAF